MTRALLIGLVAAAVVPAAWLLSRADEPGRRDAKKEITNKLGMKFVLVPKGTFWMGGGDGKPGDKQVEINETFFLGTTTVTQGQWWAIMGENPSYFSRKGGGAAKVKDISDEDLDQFPVEQVSWDDVQAFLVKLNEKENKGENLYRLPTEAQWEYACRGGATSKEDCSFDFCFAKPTNDLSSREANFDGNYPAGKAAKGPYLERTCKVGSYQPNRLGLYDMHGNVWQWCEDKYEGGPDRVIRGGGWRLLASHCRAAYRIRRAPSYRSTDLGFRLARVPSEK